MKPFLPVTLLLLFVCAPAFGVPVVTFDGTTVTVTVPAGHGVAWMTIQNYGGKAGFEADADGNGQVVLAVSPQQANGFLLVSDVVTGEWLVALKGIPPTSLAPHPARSIVRGTNGAMSQIILRSRQGLATGLWVRPGVGAWAPAGSYLEDLDGSIYNDFLFSSALSMVPLGSSPPTPAGFAHGDLFFSDDMLLRKAYGGLVNAQLDAAPSGGILSFISYDTYVVEGSSLSLLLKRTGGADGTVSVRCSSVAGTAVSGVDFTAVNEVVTFSPGETLKAIQIHTIDDSIYTVGTSLDFTIAFSEAVGAQIDPDSPGVIRIHVEENDPRPRALFGTLPASVLEGDVPWTLQVPVRLSSAIAEPVTVEFRETTAPFTSGSITFQPADTQKEIALPIAADDMPSAEKLRQLSVVASFTQESLATLKIIDDDQPELRIEDVTVVEGSVRARVVVTIPVQPATAPSITWTTVDGTAKSGQDFVAVTKKTWITELTTELTVDLIADAAVESSETFYIDITADGPVLTPRTRIAITIQDDDGGAPTPAVTIVPMSVTEGSDELHPIDVVVKLAKAHTAAVLLTFSTTAAGTAQAPADYQSMTEAVEFAPGQTERTVAVMVNGDLKDESDETFEVAVTENGIVKATATITILDDDGQTFTSVPDTTVEEKSGSSSFAVFRVTLSPPPDRVASVDYATQDGSAIAGSDYVAASGTVTFAPRQSVAEVRVEILGDVEIEPAETLTLMLSHAVGAYLHGDRATATIFDDDSPSPSVAIGRASILEGNAGTVQVPLKVVLAHALTHAVTLTVATNGTGTAGAADYLPFTQTVTFAPGHVELFVNATVLGDTTAESNETFGVEVREGSAVRARATVTIIDDDTPSRITVADVDVQERTGSTATAVFRVTISPPPVVAATIEFTTANGTATAGSDYTPFSGVVVFLPGQPSVDLPVEVLGDALEEPAETFTMRLSSAVGAVIQDDRATATIVDDDTSVPVSAFSVLDTTVTEKTGASSFAVFRVLLTPASPSSASVDYTTEDGTALSSDYLQARGTLVFNPGQTERQVQVEVFGDAQTEPAETLRLRLSRPVGAELAATMATATILDDDVVVLNPTLSVADIEVREGNGVTQATFTLTLSKALPGPARVTYSTVEHSAVPPADYQETWGSLTFAAGETAKSVVVPIAGDQIVEQTEIFRLEIRSSPDVAIGDSSAICTIVDDDTPANKKRAVRH